jgi:MaoC like domain
MVPLESLASLPSPLPQMLAAAARPRRSRSRSLHAFGFTVEGVRIDPEHLDHYTHLTGGRMGGPVPLAYPFVLASPLHLRIVGDPRFPFAALGLVHLEQRIERFGDFEKRLPLDVDAFVQNAHFGSSTATFTIETKVHQASRLLWQGSTKVLARTGKKGAGKSEAKREATPLVVREGEVEVERWSLDAGLGFRYARVAGDLNPIHLHPLVSKPFGFKRPIIHGMWTFARALATLDNGHGPAAARIAFEKPVFLPGEACLRLTPPGPHRTFSVWSPDGAVRHAHGEVDRRG